MEEKINVLGVWADNCSAKEAMRACIDYSYTDVLNVVEILTADVLVQSRMIEGVRQNIEEADLVLIGDKAILSAAKITDHRKLEEVETGLFFKMFIRFLKKTGKRVFLVADNQTELERYRGYLEEHFGGLLVAGQAVVPADDSGDDMIVNQINGLEIDCILSELSVDQQEAFIVRNRNILNARLWMRTGRIPRAGQKSLRFRETIEYLFRKYNLMKEIEKENREKEN